MKHTIRKLTLRRLAAAALMLAASGASAQTVYNWSQFGGGVWGWEDAANWSGVGIPDGNGHVASLYGSFADGTHVVQLTNYEANAGYELHGLVFGESSAATRTLTITNPISGSRNALNFTAYSNQTPYIRVTNGAALYIWPTVTVSSAGLSVDLRHWSSSLFLRGPLVGGGTLVISNGPGGSEGHVEFWGGWNSNFTGDIVVSGNGIYLDGRSAGEAARWFFGDTNGVTRIYRSAFVRVLRDAGNGNSNAEPIHIHGVNVDGSVRFFANTNSHYFGAITLHTNGVVEHSQYLPSAQAPDGYRRDFFFDGAVISDGAADWNLHILNGQGTIPSSTGTQTRLSQMVWSGTASHGGYTHLSVRRDPADAVEFVEWLQLTNGNDRLPTGTTLYLGGLLNDGGVNIGVLGANGVLILAGANQELGGLVANGTGTLNRVIGGAPTNNTLTLNIAAGTNTYTGYLGGLGGMAGYPDDPTEAYNLALVKKGGGVLNLAAPSNTYSGPTTVEAGTLLVNALQPNSAITVGVYATVGGTGRVGAVQVQTGGAMSPGNSTGILYADGAVTFNGGSDFNVEINGTTAGIDYDRLTLNGSSTLSLLLDGGVRPNLNLTLGYTPGLGDYYDIVTGLNNFDPLFDGYFEGLPDNTQFNVGGSTLEIDYQSDRIRLTVVPEPHTLGLIGVAGALVFLRRRSRQVAR